MMLLLLLLFGEEKTKKTQKNKNRFFFQFKTQASLLNAGSESFDKILSLEDFAARRHKIICSSSGNLLAVAKNREAPPSQYFFN